MNLLRYRTTILTFVAAVTTIVAIDAIFSMLFGSLGKTAASSGWNYVLTLYVFLAVIGISYYLSMVSPIQLPRFCLIPTLLSGALLGFYFGGIASDKDPQVAIISAIALSILFGIGFWQKYRFLSVAVASIATIAAYGFAFFAGTQSLSLLSVSIILPGIIWGLVCSIYIVLTINNLAIAIKAIKSTFTA